eukprot:3922080-Pleurochrysis_carterae.AAC.3
MDPWIYVPSSLAFHDKGSPLCIIDTKCTTMLYGSSALNNANATAYNFTKKHVTVLNIMENGTSETGFVWDTALCTLLITLIVMSISHTY